jgi:hypothetical protein
MFWFISPWEAARLSLEAQRHLMALPWRFMASGRRYQGLANGEEAPSEVPLMPARAIAPAGPATIPARSAMETIKEAPPMPARAIAPAGPAAVPARRAVETIKGAPPMPARSMATAGPAAVPARRAVETIKGSVGARGKGKRSKRKNKSRKK